jgi:ATP-dependent helicase/nuclease subunit B
MGSGERGLRIVFDPAIDGGAWPGALAGRSAVAGEVWLGPMGLLGRLEMEVGLGGAWASAIERACALAARLRGRDGWWRESFEADEIGTCERLLRDRDLLLMWGWQGEAVSPRLAGLWEATTEAMPGVADRVRAVIAALGARAVDVEWVRVMSPLTGMAPAWREVFAQLGARGTRVEEVAASVVRAPGDLGRAQAALGGAKGERFAPGGDRRLTLLRAHGPMAAADEVAASLAATRALERVVVVGGDEVLDAALVRHGLPRVGGEIAAPASVAIVRLVLEAAFTPMDPADLHALLCLDPGPVPRGVRWRLVNALCRFPGRGSSEWREALATGLAEVEVERREAVGRRLETLLVPAAPRDGALAVPEIARRLQAVAVWARGRAEREPSLWVAASMADGVRRMIDMLGVAEMTRVELRRLCDDLESGIGAPGEAGLAHVAQPGAVLAPADTILWWGFTRDRAPATSRLRLSVAERAGLAEAGVGVPDMGAVMEAEAARWRRPLMMAGGALVLVCPMTDEGGERCFPHPLWDELTAAMIDVRGAALLEASALTRPALAARKKARRRQMPAPALTASAGGPVALRESESPSSLERLLGCSLAWTLHYRGKLRAGLSAGPGAPDPLLYGNIAHHLLALVFADGALAQSEATARAEALIDAHLDGLSESLALPRYQVERTALRQAIVTSAGELGALLARTGATVRGVEMKAKGKLAGIAVEGTADLVLSGPDVVLDLKWGKTTNRDRLIGGTALQLAAYAELFQQEKRRPEVAYFTLRTQELLGEHGCTLPGAIMPGEHRARDTWRAAVVALRQRLAELERGELSAPGAGGEEVDAGLAGGQLVIGPDCMYCELDALCGRRGCP